MYMRLQNVDGGAEEFAPPDAFGGKLFNDYNSL